MSASSPVEPRVRCGSALSSFWRKESQTSTQNDNFWWRGNEISLHESGEGEPLLLINGLGGNTDMWRPLAAALPGFRIFSFDAPGTGRSTTPAYPVSIASLADLAAAVLDRRGIERANVLGYSYGGAIAQQLAYQHAGRVDRLVLAATTCGIGSQVGSLRALSVLGTPFRYYSPTYFERIAEATYGGRTGRNAHVRKAMIAARRNLPPSSRGYALQLLAGSSWSSLSFLHHITHESLVISGDDDPLIPVANAQMLAERIPRAQLEIVERAGHLFLLDDPRNVGGRIRRFLERSAPQKPARTNGH